MFIKNPILGVRGHSRSSTLTPVKSSSLLLVMISNMSVLICNRSHATRDNCGKIIFRGSCDLLVISRDSNFIFHNNWVYYLSLSVNVLHVYYTLQIHWHHCKQINDKWKNMSNVDRQKKTVWRYIGLPRTFALCVGCTNMQFLVTFCVLLSKIKQLIKKLCGDLTLAVWKARQLGRPHIVSTLGRSKRFLVT